MSRTLPLCTFAALCALIVVGCGKKDDPALGGGGENPSPNSGGGQPVLGARTAEDKKEAAKRLAQIGKAMHDFHDANNHLPAGVVGQKGQLGLSWRVAILPQLKQENLYKLFKLDEPWDSDHNKKLLDSMPKVFEAPGTIVSNGKTFLRSFSGPGFIPAAPPGPKGAPAFSPWANQQPGTLARGRRFNDFHDGTSNTLMVVEAAEAVEWTKPDDLPFPDQFGMTGKPQPLPKLGGLFDGGFHALLCDGSVRFISEKVPESTLRALITVAGGEVTNFDDDEPGAVKKPGGVPGPTDTPKQNTGPDEGKRP